jgi:preprotein translocase subunit YajC
VCRAVSAGPACLLPLPFLNGIRDDVIAHLLPGCLLAQAAQQPAAGEGNGAFPLLQMLVMFLPIAVLFYFMFIVPQKKKEQEMRNMVQNLKENDRVLTIGGIYGVVTNVQRDAERLTIRVDEATGTKLRVNMSSIARVLTGEEKDSGAGDNKS